MNAAALFALAIAVLAVALGLYAGWRGRWLEVGVCVGAYLVSCLLAIAAVLPAAPAWLLILAVWVVVVLVGLTAWSLIRAREKALTGQETR